MPEGGDPSIAPAAIVGSVKLAETIERWMGRVEVALAGAEGHLKDGQAALSAGEAMRARSQAHALLAKVPGSPIGLALLADACELGRLDAELALTLEELAGRVPSRADVWVRLGRVREAVDENATDAREAYVRALTVAEGGSEARREALLALADLDIAEGDGARAELWLERVADDASPEVALRRAEARLALHDVEAAKRWLSTFESPTTDGRGALARGRTLAFEGRPEAFAQLLRALVLDAKGASESLAEALSRIASTEEVRSRIKTVLEGQPAESEARWRAAFAQAEGRRDEARKALREALSSGDKAAARPLLDAALEDRDPDALAHALSAFPATSQDPVVVDARKIPTPERIADPSVASALLDELRGVGGVRARPWADAIRRGILARWIPTGTSDWPALLDRIHTHARSLHDLGTTTRIAELSILRTRPVRVAIVGEFNAGKSTFINAFMGADVAPTGVLPTTATLHHLRYAPDPLAKIFFYSPTDPSAPEPRDRILPVSELRATLKSLDSGEVRRVEIHLPLSSLTEVEILDTPGFNAPDPRHAAAAREAFEEADFAIWLLDASQPMKKSEEAVLAEARAHDLPVQILLNKADRLRPDDLTKVMDMVRSSLAAAGLSSWQEPLALSARLALAGKLGDKTALEASGWDKVQELLDATILGKSDVLKERALRHRAGKLVSALAAVALTASTDDAQREESSARRAQGFAQRAAKLDRDLEETAQRVAGALSRDALAWKRDLEVIATGRDEDALTKDPVLYRYRVDRATFHLAQSLARVVASLGWEGDREIARAEQDELPMARALVRTFASTGGNADALYPLARSAVATLIERLFALATAPTTASPSAGLVDELRAISDLLAAPKS